MEPEFSASLRIPEGNENKNLEVINFSQTSEFCMLKSGNSSSASKSNHDKSKPNIHLHNCHNITFQFRICTRFFDSVM